MTRRRKRHSPEQIIRKLRDADAMLAAGKTIGEVCQASEISEQTFHNVLNLGKQNWRLWRNRAPTR
jgi:hypothetical protein